MLKPIFIETLNKLSTCYSINEEGELFSLKYNKLKKLKLQISSIRGIEESGYKNTTIYENGLKIPVHIHRLVALAFIDNPENKPQVNHKDGNKLNNNVHNLEWVTLEENRSHAYSNKLQPKGELHYKAKISDTDCDTIRAEYATGNIKQWELAVKYSCTISNISQIIRRKTRK